MASGRHPHCGIFGGTFDPIHLGHTLAARQVLRDGGLDEMRVIPAAIPPHRDLPGANADHRLAMVRIALADEPGFLVDTRELERSGHSYTADTMAELHAEQPGTDFSLVLGLDATLGLDQWDRWEELLATTGVIAMARPGSLLPDPMPGWWRPDSAARGAVPAGKIRLMAIDPVDISATRIRAGLGAGEDMRHLLHPGVYDYIRRHRLYDFPPS